MRILTPLLLGAFFLLGQSPFLTAADSPPLNLPPGFQAKLFAGNDLAADIQCMTTNSQGQIVVSGPGYLRLLVDADGDGVADSAQTLAEAPATGAQGLFVAGTHYYCIGDEGLLEFTDENQDGVADGPAEVKVPFRTGGEHFTHAIRKGPDGWWYIIAGNDAQISSSRVNGAGSPIQTPQAGVLLRLTPDFSQLEVLADGYRNAYDFDFNAEGDLFAYDSDGERDISLPIYRPTRVFHTVPGLNHGWVSQSWKKPAHFPEMCPVVADLGRGSPTGVVSYRHQQFPPEFQNTLFVLDWTYGRVVAVKMQRQGASWVAQSKPFATGTGDFGFAPTDACVGPDGALYVAVGGRGTQGGVYRITYQENAEAQPFDAKLPPLEQVLRAPQPLSAWSRAHWEPLARKLGEEAFLVSALDSSRAVAERLRAIEILSDLFQGPDIDFLRDMAIEPERELRARAIWAYGRCVAGQPDQAVLQQALQDSSPVVIRSALEILLGCSAERLEGFEEQIADLLGHDDRVVRQQTVLVASKMNNDSFRKIGEIARTTGWPEAMQMARAFVSRGYVGHPYAWHDIGLEALRRHKDHEHLLTATLLIQHALGGFGDSPVHPSVFDGYLARLPLPSEPEKLQALATQLEALYPVGEPIIDEELVRLSAMITASSPQLLDKMLAQITPESGAVQDLHLLIAAACLPAPRTPEQTQKMADSLLELFVKLEAEQAPIDRNWEPRVSEMFVQMVAIDPSLPATIADHKLFGRPEHTMFVKQMEGEVRQKALTRFQKGIETSQLEVTPGLLSLFLGAVDEAALQIARQSQSDELLQPTALLLIAEANRPEDRSSILAGLASPHRDVVAGCLDAQEKWDDATPDVLVAQAKLLSRLAEEKEPSPLWQETLIQLSQKAARLMSVSTNASLQSPPAALPEQTPPQEIVQQWFEWISSSFPDYQEQLQAREESRNLEQWEELFAKVDWSAGDAERGAVLYQKQQCAQCHQGRNAVGPNLEGVSRRFSQQDLLIAIVDPHRDVSSRYRTTLITTVEGKTYSGIIIYESIDGLLLRDSTHRTVRIDAADIEFRKQLTSSLMPENLLKESTPADVADLLAYLKSLGPQEQVTAQP